jgi:voltage-gated potassium channel
MDTSAHGEKISAGQMLILGLSLYVLLALLVEALFTLPPETVRLLQIIDTLICLVFIGDFCVRLWRAERKWAYLKWGWIDLVSSIPNCDLLRWGRAIRILRILRAIRSLKAVGSILFRQRAKGAFLSVTLMAILLVIFSSITVLNCETAERSNIKTAGDALWWSVATITTVGYGDHYPVTTEGRLLGVVLMIAGIGLFGTFTAFIAAYFLDSGKSTNARIEALAGEIKQLRDHLKSNDRHQSGPPPPTSTA